MFSNDRFMTMATGLVLAIAVGSLAQNSGFVSSLLSGEDPSASHDDQYTVRAGKNQVLDVLTNDGTSGDITIVNYPTCGSLRSAEGNTLEFYNSEDCSGDIAFSYCVPVEGNCDAQQVALNVINLNLDTAQPTTQIAKVEEKPVTAPVQTARVTPNTQSAPASKPAPATTQALELVEITTEEKPVNSTPEIAKVAEARTVIKQGDRLIAGQILVEDDQNDVIVSGFGASSPSLFSPNMSELVKPQDTVAALRSSVEVVTPSTVNLDQNIKTQTSAASPTRVEAASNTQVADVSLGIEASPVVFFSSPTQPRLSRAPMLAHVGSDSQGAEIIERAPDIMSSAPTRLASIKTDEQKITAPVNSGLTTRIEAAVAMVLKSNKEQNAETDTSSAQVGDVMVVWSTGNNDTSVENSAFANSSNGGDRASSDIPALVTTAEAVLSGSDLNVDSVSPTGFTTEGNTIDNLFASVSISDTYEEARANENNSRLGSSTASGTLGNVDSRNASVNSVEINPNTMIDSSDVVTEMAAQIILPNSNINDSMTRVVAASPVAEALMSDKLFAANLETSAPPSEDPVKVASLAPISPVITKTDIATTAQCDVRMSTASRPGAEIAVFVSSRCRPNQVVTISQSHFSFSARTDNRGTISTNIPAFATVANIDAVFEDGATANSTVTLQDAADIERFGIVWSVPVNLDLHAFEGGARQGSKGHVWVNNQRTYRDTLTGGGGYLETFGDSTIAGGAMAEVYSLPTNRIRRETTVDMDLRISNIEAYCDNSMVLRTIRTEDGNPATKREFSMKLPKCGTATGGLVLESFVDPITVASR